MERKYSVFLGNVGTSFDRHCPDYAGKKFTIEELFDRVASIEKMTGVDIAVSPDIWENLSTVKESLKRTGLIPVSLVVDLFGQPQWKQGSFSAPDEKIRKWAIEESRKVMDLAEELGCEFITIWPGQDGYDYHFQADYIKERTDFADGIREICRYKPGIGVALEYKIREPRTHNYINTVGSTILTVKEVNEANCGIALDIGHCFFAKENSAEVIALISKWGGNLLHLHMNDNFSSADDDLIVGTVRTTEYLEFLYWLRRTGYKGWFTMDQFPYREDGKEAVEESVKWLDTLESVMDKADPEEIAEVLKSKDAIAASRLSRKLIFNQ